jgi:hypothetical protein
MDQVSERVELGKDAPGMDARHTDAPQQDAPGRDAPWQESGPQGCAARTRPARMRPATGNAPQDAPTKEASPRLRRRFLRSNSILFLVSFVLPLAAFAAYLLFFASERYESLASATITEEKTARNRSTSPCWALPIRRRTRIH